MEDNNSTSAGEDSKTEELNPLKIETPLPTTAVGIENMKESYRDSMSPHRKIYKWFARRPTAATRLAILASILPEEVSNDELMRLMCIGPKGVEKDIEDYVISREITKDDRDGSIEDHFGYDYPHSQIPSEKQVSDFHRRLKEEWNGELPVVLDPTAGGGTIPLEATRYGLPTISNELNPVAWIINKVILDYARDIGSLEAEVERWTDVIRSKVSEEISELYPKRNGVEPNYYFRTYSIDCPSCGKRFPLSNRWWFNKKKNAAVRPIYDDGQLTFKIVNTESISESEFDPNEGTVHRGDAECPHCSTVTEREDIATLLSNEEFEFEVCGVKYAQEINGSKYHSPTEEDYDAVRHAEEQVENDLQLSVLLNEDRYIGRQDRAAPYGITKWRDLFSPRQLIAHASFLDAFDEVKPDIRGEYREKEAEAILVILSLIGSRQVNHNSRLVPIHARFGYPDNMLGNRNFAFQWHFGEGNPLAGGKTYQTWTKNVLKNYEEVVQFHVSADNEEEIKVLQGDGADLPLEENSIQSVVIDPPYGDNVMYSELSDALYVWLRKYLGDVFPNQFSSVETDKRKEAVENSEMATVKSGESRPEAARREYEEKMAGIFQECYRVLEPGGVITIYFTDKEINAWDSLTMSIIDSGFTITATHTITSESPERIGMRGRSSADTTLLLTCRKPVQGDRNDLGVPTLWSDIREQTRQSAKEKADEILNSDLNLTKTDTIISAFGPTLRVFTENYPVVDMHDEKIRPKEALEEARTAVTEVLIDHELDENLDDVDSLTRWYILSWLVYERESIPYDEGRQLGLGVGVEIDDIKQSTKIWGKSGDSLVLKAQDYRVRDFTILEAGKKRRKRAYPVDPREESFEYSIDTVHAALNVLETKGGEFTWNWLKDRDLQNNSSFRKTVESLIQVLPENYDDRKLLINLASGQTGELLDIDSESLTKTKDSEESKTTLQDF